MNKVNVFLQPGDFHFAGQNTRIQTLLGSCIAIVLWHPIKRIGGMCHYMLPTSGNNNVVDGKYADGAMQLFLQRINSAGTKPSEYQAKIFGGGNMFPKQVSNKSKSCQSQPCNHLEALACQLVGCKNIKMAHHIIEQNGFKLENHDVGGTQHRKLIFDIATGEVILQKG